MVIFNDMIGKKIHIGLLLILLSVAFPSFSQQTEKAPKTLRNFIEALHNPQIELKTIISDYLCRDTTLTDSIRQELQKLITLQLEEIRDSLSEMDISKIDYVPYAVLEEPDQLDFVDEDDVPYIYGLRYNNQIFMHMYAKDKRIHAFATMRKGNIRFLMMLCKEDEASAVPSRL